MLVQTVSRGGVVGLTDHPTEKSKSKSAAIRWGDGHGSSPRSIHSDMNACTVIDQQWSDLPIAQVIVLDVETGEIVYHMHVFDQPCNE